MVILDTDTLSLAFLEHEKVSARIEAAEEAGEVVATSIVTWAEVMKGRIEYLLKAPDSAHWLRAYTSLMKTQDEFAKIEVIPVTAVSAAHFDRLRTDKKRKKTGHPDLLIACIALAHDATLATRNVKDFQHIANLRVENWAA